MIHKVEQLLLRAKKCLEEGNLDKGIALYEEAVELSSESSDYSNRLFLSASNFASILHNLGASYHSQGEYEKSFKAFRKALEIRKVWFGGDDLTTANTLHHLGSVYHSTGEYGKAIELLQEVLRIQKAKLGEDHLDVADTLNNLGVAYRSTGEYGKAIEVLEEALRIRRAKPREDHLDVADTLNRLGGVYHSTGEYGKAIELLQEAVRIQKAKLGEDHLDVADTLNNLGVSYLSIGEYGKAVEYFLEALRIQKAKLGEDHLDVATTLNYLGVLYRSIGEYGKAIEYFLEALRIQKARLGEDHLDVADTLNRLGSAYHSSREYGKDIEVLEEAVRIQKAKLGKDNLDVADTLNRLGSAYHSSREYGKDIEVLEEAVRIQKAKLGEDHLDVADTLNRLGSAYHLSLEYGKAIEVLEEALRIRRAKLGEDHLDIADTLNRLGGVYHSTGEYGKAFELLQEALRIQKAKLGEDHLDVATTLNYLGAVYNSAGEYEKAIGVLEEALRIRRAKLGEDHLEVATTLNYLGVLYHSTGEYRKAVEYYLEALRIQKAKLGEDNLDVATTLNYLGVLYRSIGEYEKAIEVLEEALRIQKTKLGKDNLNVAYTLNSLGAVYNSAGDYEKAIEVLQEALRILKSKLVKDNLYISVVLASLASNYYSSTGEYEKAIEVLQEALEILKAKLGEHTIVATILDFLGSVYNSIGEYEKAIDVLQKALEMQKDRLDKDHPEVAITLRRRALVSLSTNEIEKALDDFLQALESLNRFILLRGHTESSVYKFIDDNVLLSEYILSVLLLTDPPAEKKEEAYEALLNAKVIGYQVAMNVYLSILSGNHPQLSEKFDLLLIKRAEYSNLILKNPTGAREREEVLLEEIDSLERELAIQIPELETDIESRILSLEKMRASIPESSVLLDFYHYREVILGEKNRPEFGKGKYGLFKVKREGELELIDLGYSDEIDEKIKGFREEIVPKSEMTSKEREMRLETVRQLAGELYDSLLSKALTNEKIERIMISPDGMLNFLPFETLVRESQYLVEEFKITYLSSPKDIVRFNNIKGNGTKDIHIYSHPDYDFNFPGGEIPEKDIEPPETKGMTIKSLREKGLEFKSLEFSGRYEVDSISRAVKGNSLNLKDPKTKEAAHEHSIREIKKPAILHISTHGFFLDKEKEKPELMELQVFGEMGPMIRYDDPLKRSGLALAGVNRVIKGEPVCEEVEDGILTAYDIVSLDVYGAELVVLSACDTGIGEIKTGQGVMGFRRSFTLAGVKTLVMSLWEVPTNETAILMENFYDNLFREKGKADSLREAQLKMMKEDYDDPYYWGAFIVQGENNII